ncbi:MAG: DUF3857 domain-containing protein [Acidobacteriota bacterium]
MRVWVVVAMIVVVSGAGGGNRILMRCVPWPRWFGIDCSASFLEGRAVKASVGWCVAVVCLSMAGAGDGWAQVGKFVAPTADELAMKSAPGFPNAGAVVLYREDITRDGLGYDLHYRRIKVLKADGLKYGNVELEYVQGDDGRSMTQIAARTIHADGTVVMFTGKPMEKQIVKGKGFKVKEVVFALPDVEVGSILEYSYTELHPGYVRSPEWTVQEELPELKELLVWEPSWDVQNGLQSMGSISWSKVLPAGADVEQIAPGGLRTTGARSDDELLNGAKLKGVMAHDLNGQMYVLEIANVPPLAEEDHMPPKESVGYSVRFTYLNTVKAAHFWQSAGADWSKEVDKFCVPNDALKAATAEVVGTASSDEEKLRKIYVAVSRLDNTDYSRKRADVELKAAGFGKLKAAADVWARRSGDSVELARLFLAMVRAAGMEAYAMRVADRSQRLFDARWEDEDQLTDEIVGVPHGAGMWLFDPGTPYCDFNHVGWEHAGSSGMRQTAKGAVLAGVPQDNPRLNAMVRTAWLTMDALGGLTGKLELNFTGSAAMRWRQKGMGDAAVLEDALRKDTAASLPSQWTLGEMKIEGAEDVAQPLTATIALTANASAGKRVLLPADVFEASSEPVFVGKDRTTPVMFRYTNTVTDTLRLTLPAGATVEAAPEAAKVDGSPFAGYALATGQTGATFVMQTKTVLAKQEATVQEYPQLLEFYGKVRAANAQAVVVKMGEK